MTTVAIDGPGGSGKSTISKEVARRLGVAHLDTGAMYRSLALVSLRRGIKPDDEQTLSRVAKEMELVVGERVVLFGEDVTEEIRKPDVDEVVSLIARHKDVRSELVRRQRAFVKEHNGAVVEGRDIGSVVLVDADLKIFLTASADVRASRRRAQHVGKDATDIDEIRSGLSLRDEIDSTRDASPLVVATDALVIDSGSLSIDEVVEKVLQHL